MATPRPRLGARGLTDYLPKRDLTAWTLAYNNTLDRMRMELPPSGDPGASGVVQLDLNNWDGALPTLLRDRDGDEAEITDGALTTIDYEYDQAVRGNLYSVSHINSSLPSASSHIYLIDMDPRVNLAIIAKIRAAGEFHVEMYEGADVSGSGTRIWAQNFNRTQASGIATKFYYNSWVNPSGTKIFECITADDYTDVSTEASSVWILDQSKNYYVLSLTNRTGSNAASSVEFLCRENDV